MSLPFARSTRALYIDRERPALIVLVLALLLLVLWTIWFFWAPITLYETGKIVGATRRGTWIASFPAEAATRLQSGQLALLKPHASATQQTKAIPAMVSEVRTSVVDGKIQADLYPLVGQLASVNRAADPQAPSDVTVEVEQISPATFVLRSSGQWLNTPSVLVSPQTQ